MPTISTSDPQETVYLVAHDGGVIAGTWSGPAHAADSFTAANWAGLTVVVIDAEGYAGLHGKLYRTRVIDGRVVVASPDYAEHRRNEYPPMADFADALYWREQGDPQKWNAYMAAVAAVKSKHLKG